MLMQMRALTAAARTICYATAVAFDVAVRAKDALAGAAPYLRLFGATLGGCCLASEALAARSDGDPQRSVALARFFAEHVTVQAPSIEKSITDGAEAVTGADAVLLG